MPQINALVLTFNCGREPVKPTVFGQHIAEAIENGPKHELIVLSLQEISPISYAFVGGRCLSFYYERLRESLKTATDPDNYINIFTENIGMTATMVFVHQDYRDRVKVTESGSVGLGWSEMGNKGAVGVKLRWLTSPGQYIDLTFVAAHLAPHEPALERRNQDWMHIVQRLILLPKGSSALHLKSTNAQDLNERPSLDSTEDENQPLLSKPATSESSKGNGKVDLSTIYDSSSFTFFAGDLNYRTSNEHPNSEDLAKFPKSSDSSTLINNLLQQDQLTSQREQGKTLHGFQEAEITFPPTYKYNSKAQNDIATTENDGSFVKKSKPPGDVVIPLGYAQHRWPSWCDRVLYLPALSGAEGDEVEIKNNFYKSLPLMSTSDHQPVVASFSIPSKTETSEMSQRTTTGNNYQFKPPYTIDPLWKERFTAARRKEFAVGILAYLGMTWEGNSILLTVFVGAVGIHLASRSGLL